MMLHARKKGLLLFSILFIISLMGCRQAEKGTPGLDKLVLTSLKELDQFEEINGYKTKEGCFYFTIYQRGSLSFYEMDLTTQKTKPLFENIQENLSFIPIEHDRAIYIDQDSNLFHRNGDQIIQIDTEISGVDYPNILVSRNGEGVLYTKGEGKNASVYRYMIQDQQGPVKVIDSISEDAFTTFQFTTQWSNVKNYFIYHNEMIYDEEGQPILPIRATIAKWAPQDDYLAYIALPLEAENPKPIKIGDWNTYIGTQLMLMDIAQKSAVPIFTETAGLIDPIESIQWNWEGSQLGISQGTIIEREGYFEKLDYQRVLVYDMKTKKKTDLANMPYNFYEFLTPDLLYGKSLGVEEELAVMNIHQGKVMEVGTPKLLNSFDMFAITTKDRSFLLDGKKLLQINAEGIKSEIIEFPWEVSSLYFDEETSSMVVINRSGKAFILLI